MVTLGDAVLFLTANTNKLDQGLDEAEGKTQSWAGRLGGAASNLMTGVVAGGALAAVGAVLGIGAAALDVSAQTDRAAANMAASLGIPRAEAEKFAEVARQVYGNNFAESVEDAGAAVAEVTRLLQLGAGDPALKTITENALALRDTFEVDVTESVSTARTLMENFGLSSDEAFDLITAGYQRGLDRSGDFIDTINEYSVQFANGGASAQEFFGLLESGLQGGMLGTDKAADAFKEFRVRILDGSKTTATALEQIGLNADEITSQIDNGSLTIADAWNLVIGKLKETKDQSVLMQAGVGLIGTQFEDLGQQAILQMAMVEGAFGDVAGATDSLNEKYATFGDLSSAIWRRLVVAIAPASDALLDLANAAMPAIMGAFTQLEQILIGQVVPAITGIIEWFRNLSPETQRLILQITGLAAVLLPLIPLFGVIAGAIGFLISPIGLVIGAVGLLAAAWYFNWGGIQEATANAALLIQGILDGLKLAWASVSTAISTGWLLIKDAVTIAVAEFSWSDFVTALSWPVITAFEWATWVTALVWPTVAEFSWSDFVTALSWPVITAFEWATWVTALVWPTVAEFSWSDFVTALSWPVITAFAWKDWIGQLVWPAVTKVFGWDDWLDTLDWPASAKAFSWGSWIVALVWPENAKAFDWGDWVDALDWPSDVLSFAWDDYVDVVDWGIPEFPGWTAFWNWVWGNESGNATEAGSGEQKSGRSTLSESSRAALRTGDSMGRDALSLAPSTTTTIITVPVTVNAAVGGDLDLYRLADELSDLVSRRVRSAL